MKNDQPAEGFPPIEADTIPELLRIRVKQFGEKVFMRRKNLGIWQAHTFNQAYEEIRNLALGLMVLGIKKGETVAIMGENELETFWSVWGAMCAGGKVVCIYPDATQAELTYILNNSEARYVFAEDQEQVDKALQIEKDVQLVHKVIYWDSRGLWNYDNPVLMKFKDVQEKGEKLNTEQPDLFDKLIDQSKHDDIAALTYSSGTTGLPKGVILTYDYLMDTAMRIMAYVPIRPFLRYLSYLSPATIAELWFGITIGLIAPFEINLPEEPETILDNIHELGPELLCFGPRQWESMARSVQSQMMDAGVIRNFIYNLGLKVGYKIAASPPKNKTVGSIWWKMLHPLAKRLVLTPVRDNLGLRNTYHATSAGAAMSPDVFRFFHAIGVRLRNLYGSTEGGLFSIHTGNKFDLETVGMWAKSHPHFGSEFTWRLSDEGELQVKGGSGFSGYYKNEEATKKALTDDGWFKTGDSVRVRDDGQLIYLDRLADLRKLANGYRFPPQFIETRLRFSPFIKDVMVLGDENKSFVSALVNIEPENTGRWAEQNGFAYATFSELSQLKEVRDLIKKEVVYVNSMLDKDQTIKSFINLPKELDPDEAELTRSRKLRRDFLEDKYKNIIVAIYAGKNDVDTEIPIKYQDGREGLLKAKVFINTVS
jgi:long-chain acyl-CoA synthetase